MPNPQSNTPSNDIALKIQNLTQMISYMQLGKPKKSYKLQEICPYPFDCSITNDPLPINI